MSHACIGLQLWQSLDASLRGHSDRTDEQQRPHTTVFRFESAAPEGELGQKNSFPPASILQRYMLHRLPYHSYTICNPEASDSFSLAKIRHAARLRDGRQQIATDHGLHGHGGQSQYNERVHRERAQAGLLQ